jgi:hypothetical protein
MITGIWLSTNCKVVTSKLNDKLSHKRRIREKIYAAVAEGKVFRIS